MKDNIELKSLGFSHKNVKREDARWDGVFDKDYKSGFPFDQLRYAEGDFKNGINSFSYSEIDTMSSIITINENVTTNGSEKSGTIYMSNYKDVHMEGVFYKSGNDTISLDFNLGYIELDNGRRVENAHLSEKCKEFSQSLDTNVLKSIDYKEVEKTFGERKTALIKEFFDKVSDRIDTLNEKIINDIKDTFDGKSDTSVVCVKDDADFKMVSDMNDDEKASYKEQFENMLEKKNDNVENNVEYNSDFNDI